MQYCDFCVSDVIFKFLAQKVRCTWHRVHRHKELVTSYYGSGDVTSRIALRLWITYRVVISCGHTAPGRSYNVSDDASFCSPTAFRGPICTCTLWLNSSYAQIMKLVFTRERHAVGKYSTCLSVDWCVHHTAAWWQFLVSLTQQSTATAPDCQVSCRRHQRHKFCRMLI